VASRSRLHREGAGLPMLVRVQQIANMTEADIRKVFHEPARSGTTGSSAVRYPKLLQSPRQGIEAAPRAQGEQGRLSKEHQRIRDIDFLSGAPGGRGGASSREEAIAMRTRRPENRQARNEAQARPSDAHRRAATGSTGGPCESHRGTGAVGAAQLLLEVNYRPCSRPYGNGSKRPPATSGGNDESRESRSGVGTGPSGVLSAPYTGAI